MGSSVSSAAGASTGVGPADLEDELAEVDDPSAALRALRVAQSIVDVLPDVLVFTRSEAFAATVLQRHAEPGDQESGLEHAMEHAHAWLVLLTNRDPPHANASSERDRDRCGGDDGCKQALVEMRRLEQARGTEQGGGIDMQPWGIRPARFEKADQVSEAVLQIGCYVPILLPCERSSSLFAPAHRFLCRL
jgi:hypothetical protein